VLRVTTSSAPQSSAVPVIRPADASDGATAERLLVSADLPVAGVAEAVGNFFVAEVPAGVVGVAGLEIHGDDGILRSVAVAAAERGRGLGALLTDRVLAHARRSGLRRVYLLTTTAEAYFARHGFGRTAREDVPARVRDSVEFREACPASAVAMVLELSTGGEMTER
jgi:amino-acid N-acetyltransferase